MDMLHELVALALHGSLLLLALSIGAFGIGVTEFSPMGMLPLIANDPVRGASNASGAS